MATGKKALDIFTPTQFLENLRGKGPDIGIEVAERIEGRPRAAEPYQKVTVTLCERHILYLGEVALVIRKRTGQAVSRSEMIRAIVDKVAGSLNPEGPDFDKNVRELFPVLKA